MMDINYITQENQLESLKVLQDTPYLYLDTEVMIKDFENIDFFNDKIRLIQIGDEENTFVIDLLKINPEVVKNHIQNLIENKGIIGHNLKFDLKFLKTNLNILPKIVFDTMIASQILAKGDSNQRHSLSASAKRFVSLDVDKTYQKSPWWAKDLSSEQIEYAAKDIDALRHLFKEEKNQLNQDNLHKKASGETFKVFGVINPVAALEMAFLPALVEIELSGIPIDEEEAKKLLKQKELEFQADYMKFKIKTGADPFSPLQVVNYLTNKLKIKLPKTEKGSFSSQDVFLKDYEDIEEVRLLLKLRADKKIIDKIKEILQFTRNKRVYGEFKQIGAATGRMSSLRPNLQNIPKNLKYLFKPKEGYKFIVADYSQIELRIAAQYTKDENMITAFNEGKDLHKLTASIITGKSYDEITKEERQLAKAINFGLIYGMSPKSLIEYAKANYGVSINLQEAKKFHENYFKFYKSFKDWHDRVKEHLDKHRFTTLETLLGRKLIAYKFTDAVNYPIQGSGSDLLKMAVVFFFKERNDLDAKVVNLVHDEILVEVAANDIEKAKEVLSSSMEKAGKLILKDVPVAFEMVVSDSWSKE